MARDSDREKVVPETRDLEDLVFLARSPGAPDNPKKEYRISYDSNGKPEAIASGSFATTYIAVPVKGSHEEIVVKILQADINQKASHRDAFHKEAAISDGIHFRNIVDVLGTGYAVDEGWKNKVIDGQKIEYIAMEKMHLSLAEALSTEFLQTRLDAKFIADMFSSIVSGLEYADYHHGIRAHKDLHPGNILLNFKGSGFEVKIADFGRAHVRKGEAKQLQFTTQIHGRTIGTENEAPKPIPFNPDSCIAPEVDDERYQDNLLDVFSLGRIGNHLTLIYTSIHGDDPSIVELDDLFSKAAKNRNLQKSHKIEDLADFMDKVAGIAGIKHIHINPDHYWREGGFQIGEEIVGEGMKGKAYFLHELTDDFYPHGFAAELAEDFRLLNLILARFTKDGDLWSRLSHVIREGQNEVLHQQNIKLREMKVKMGYYLSARDDDLPKGKNLRTVTIDDVLGMPEMQLMKLKFSMNNWGDFSSSLVKETVDAENLIEEYGFDTISNRYFELRKHFTEFSGIFRKWQGFLDSGIAERRHKEEVAGLQSALEECEQQLIERNQQFEALQNKTNGIIRTLKAKYAEQKSKFRWAIGGLLTSIVLGVGGVGTSVYCCAQADEPRHYVLHNPRPRIASPAGDAGRDSSADGAHDADFSDADAGRADASVPSKTSTFDILWGRLEPPSKSTKVAALANLKVVSDAKGHRRYRLHDFHRWNVKAYEDIGEDLTYDVSHVYVEEGQIVKAYVQAIDPESTGPRMRNISFRVTNSFDFRETKIPEQGWIPVGELDRYLNSSKELDRLLHKALDGPSKASRSEGSPNDESPYWMGPPR